MRVLVVTTNYAPDLGAGASLYEMLCEDLVRMGCQVSVVCAVPHYPTGRVNKEFRGALVKHESRNGVDVTRVWVPSLNRACLSQRLIIFLCYQLLATIVGLQCDYDTMIVGNPALEVFLPFAVLSVLRRKASVFSVHDLYPDAGIKLGVFRHRSVIWLVDWIERFCYRHAARIRVLSEGFAKSLSTRVSPPSKLVLIWDWLDTNFISPVPRANSFSYLWGLDTCFVVMYAGNIGLTQGLETVLETARLLIGEAAIRFVLVGDGATREQLQRAAHTMDLINVQFIPFQPRELLSLVLGSADVGLLSLKRGFGTDSVPSKCYSILASGRPVIASIDTNSDTAILIERARCGVCVEPQDPQALADAVLRMYRNGEYCAQLGANAREYVVTHHSREAAAQEFYKILCGLPLKAETTIATNGICHG